MAVNLRHLLPAWLILLASTSGAQPVTGTWQGRITFPGAGLGKTYNLELKLERSGDSLSGYAYYYTSRSNFYMLPVEGYFNPYDGTVSWWHAGETAMDGGGRTVLSPLPREVGYVTDFNCPGEGTMLLDGNAEVTAGGRSREIPVHLRKTEEGLFPDDPPVAAEEDLAVVRREPERRGLPALRLPDWGAGRDEGRKKKPAEETEKQPIPREAETPPVMAESRPPATVAPPGVSDLFQRREKRLVTELPALGDTLSLDFYDHAEIDGDSIAIFLGPSLLQEHILLKASPFTLRLPVASLGATTELTMVAENLGRIPPNTSLMIAYIGGQRYEVRLESTEQTSAMIRLVKPAATAPAAGQER